MPRRVAPTPRHRSDGARPERTYVVFRYPRPIAPREAVTIVGTVRAVDRRAARPLAFALARQRGHRPGPAQRGSTWALRWWAASVCRSVWLVEALARDGAALLAPERA